MPPPPVCPPCALSEPAGASGHTSLDGMADGIVEMTDTIATMECEFTNYIMFAKQQVCSRLGS